MDLDELQHLVMRASRLRAEAGITAALLIGGSILMAFLKRLQISQPVFLLSYSAQFQLPPAHSSLLQEAPSGHARELMEGAVGNTCISRNDSRKGTRRVAQAVQWMAGAGHASGRLLL